MPRPAPHQRTHTRLGPTRACLFDLPASCARLGPRAWLAANVAAEPLADSSFATPPHPLPSRISTTLPSLLSISSLLPFVSRPSRMRQHSFCQTPKVSSCDLVQFVRFAVGRRRLLLLRVGGGNRPRHIVHQAPQDAGLLGLARRSADGRLFVCASLAGRRAVLNYRRATREGVEGVVNDAQIEGRRNGLEDCRRRSSWVRRLCGSRPQSTSDVLWPSSLR